MLSPTIQIYKVFSELWIWTLSSISVVEGMLLGDERKMCFIWKMHKKPQVSKQHVLPYDLLTCPSTSYPEWDLPSSGSISNRCCPKSPQNLKQDKLINFKKWYSPDLKAVLRNLVCVCVCVCWGWGVVKSLQSCPTLCDPMDCSPPGSSVHGDSPGKSTGVECHALLQGIFPTRGLNPHLLCLPHWQVGSLPLMPPGKPPRNLSSFYKQCQQEGAKDIPFINTCYLLQHKLPQ